MFICLYIHIYIRAQSVEAANVFHASFLKEFGPLKDCTGDWAGDPRGGQGNVTTLEMCDFGFDRDAAGPFNTPQGAFFVPEYRLREVLIFSIQHRSLSGNMPIDILIHPNTGCETEDHSVWALWNGNSWPINFDVFECEDPSCHPKQHLPIILN